MADIFISYSNQDRAIAKQLADKLSLQGYSVWWDTSLVPGETYRAAIMSELESATRVFVIWTPASVKSEWVISEAERAARMNKLVTLRVPDLDILAIPPPFDQRHSVIVDDVTSALNASPGHKAKAGPDLLRQGMWKAWSLLSGLWVTGWFLFGILFVITSWDWFKGIFPEFFLTMSGPPIVLFLAGFLYFTIHRGFRPR